MAEKSKLLIIGATGHVGKFMVEASVKAGHPTFALVRKSTVSDPVKGKLVENFSNSGVTVLYGDLHDHESLVKAIKHVDVVISTVGDEQKADQVKIIAAIKEAGNIKRFFPSEFILEIDVNHAVEPVKSMYEGVLTIRRAIEAEGIPYTYVSAQTFTCYFFPSLFEREATAPPGDKVTILGDGNTKVIYNDDRDIATYTIKAVDDPRTLNKILHFRLPKNIYTVNELVSLWEKKSGKTLERTYVPEEQLLKDIQDAPFETRVELSIKHSVLVRGEHNSEGVEASELYPDVKYTTIEEYLDQFV
ncbi:hypothetical protein F0562_030622 [Nyssa sinensis]|uniref:NmrA-like domain-containing protein n=1 Tax=Nyssa sinensis TaxID=561372 RepID=A0A5J5AZ16_9ASTE|nr:hypothetical protein F0562_030622 [Nyssa sinensis]